jgi:hypothetical protein
MATPPELVQAVSEATGLPPATVVDMDRRLVKAKLRPVGGRGLSAVKLGSLDAARLLTAVLGSPQSNRAAEAVLRYTQTRPDKARSSDGLFGAAKIDDLAKLPPRHGFVEALAALIASAATGSLASMISAMDEASPPHIEVFAFTRATHGRIRISGLRRGTVANVEYLPASTEQQAAKLTRGSTKAQPVLGDLEQSRRITERTIIQIARLFVEESA